MSDDHLNPSTQLAFIPGFAFFRRNLRRQYRHPDPFFRQDALQPPRDISLLGVNRVDLYFSSAIQRSP